MRTSLTATLLSKIAFITLLFSGFIASAKAAPLQGLVLRASFDQFTQNCGTSLCEVTLTFSETFSGPKLVKVEVEPRRIQGDVAISSGIIEVNGSFEVSGQWFQIDAPARRIVAANAPSLPAVASTR